MRGFSCSIMMKFRELVLRPRVRARARGALQGDRGVLVQGAGGDLVQGAGEADPGLVRRLLGDPGKSSSLRGLKRGDAIERLKTARGAGLRRGRT